MTCPRHVLQADPSRSDCDGLTPRLAAAARGHEAVVAALLEAGACGDASDSLGYTAATIRAPFAGDASRGGGDADGLGGRLSGRSAGGWRGDQAKGAAAGAAVGAAAGSEAPLPFPPEGGAGGSGYNAHEPPRVSIGAPPAADSKPSAARAAGGGGGVNSRDAAGRAVGRALLAPRAETAPTAAELDEGEAAHRRS